MVSLQFGARCWIPLPARHPWSHHFCSFEQEPINKNRYRLAGGFKPVTVLMPHAAGFSAPVSSSTCTYLFSASSTHLPTAYFPQRCSRLVCACWVVLLNSCAAAGLKALGPSWKVLWFLERFSKLWTVRSCAGYHCLCSTHPFPLTKYPCGQRHRLQKRSNKTRTRITTTAAPTQRSRNYPCLSTDASESLLPQGRGTASPSHSGGEGVSRAQVLHGFL